jgi:hypothetical protein
MSDEEAGAGTDSSSAHGPDQDHRDRQIWWMLTAIGFVAFIAVIMLGRPLVEGRLAAARNLDRATTIVLGTSSEFAAIDSAVRSPSATDSKALESISATRDVLQEASELSLEGFDRLTTDEQKRATIVKALAAARIDALAAAEAVLSAGGEGAGNAGVRQRAFNEYKRAAEKARQADAALVKL